MQDTIISVRKIPLMKKLLGYTLFFVGLFGVITQGLALLIPTAIGFYLVLADGTEIDVENRRYREVKSFLGQHFGSWKWIPELEYISVFKTVEKTKVQGRGASTIIANKVYKLNLFYDRNKKIQAYVTEDKDDAFRVAQELAIPLKLDILDATEMETKWL